MLLGLEGLDGLGTEPDWLHTLYHLGFRHAMLTWSTDNAFAAGSAHEGPGDGLTGPWRRGAAPHGAPRDARGRLPRQ